MNCPKCSGELDSVNVNGVMLETCDSCEGVWFDSAELLKIIQITEEELRGSSIAPSLEDNHENDSNESGFRATCPKCAEPMAVQTYCYDSGVKMDKCNICGGIWLDDGEIKAVIDYYKEGMKALMPEKMNEITEKLEKIEKEWNAMEDQLADGMVKTDELPGLAGVPGKILQAIYRYFMRIGI